MTARTTTCSMALSVNCDSTKENQDAFKVIFETAHRGLLALAGAVPHGNGNAQFYGGMDFPEGDKYFHERDVEDSTPAPATSGGIRKGGA